MIKYVFKFVPYYEYDINSLEQWLSDMAKKGLMFKRFIFGMACFERVSPYDNIRFCFIPEPEGTGLFCQNAGEPDNDFRKMCSEAGWNYIIGYNDFHVFYTEGDSAIDLLTDDDVTAMAIDEIKKKKKSSLFGSLMYCIVYCFLISRLAGSVVMPMVLMGTLLFVFSVFIIAANWINAIKRVRYLNKLSKDLRERNLSENKSAKFILKGAYKPIIGLLTLIWGICIIRLSFSPLEERLSLNDYNEPFPFATIADMIPGEYKGSEYNYGSMNTMRVKSDILAPLIIDYTESADVILENGQNWYGSADIVYISFKNEILADIAAKEIVRIDKMRKGKFTYVDIPNVDSDFAVGYLYNEKTIGDTPSIVLRKDNRLMRITFYQFTGSVDMKEWLRVAAERL